MKNLGVLIAYGSEVRSFIYSGLLEKLLPDYRLTLFSIQDIAKHYPFPDTVTMLLFPLVKENLLLQKCRGLAIQLHAQWYEKSGGKRWSYYVRDPKAVSPWGRWRSFLLRLVASAGMVAEVSRLERITGRFLGTSNTWRNLFQSCKIDALLSFSLESGRVLPALQTGSNLGLPSLIVMHSWKDTYTKPHISTLLERILVWNPRGVDMVTNCNPWINRSRLAVIGSLHLSPFLRLSGLLPREEFCRQTGLDPQRPMICYTAGDPLTSFQEENLVAFLLEAIYRRRLPQNYQLLLRLNPMEDGQRFAPLLAKYPGDLVIQYPKWEWFPDRMWACQLPEDTPLWVSAAYYAAMNISLPSTVTLEFGILRKPVINICFDLPPAPFPEASNRRYWFSDWYAEIRGMNLALPAFDEEELLARIREIASRPEPPLEGTASNQQHSWLFLDAVSQAKIMIDEVLRN